MAKHRDEESIFDSTAHHEDRRSKIKAENEEKKLVDQTAAERNAENVEIANFRGLPKEGETREQLLDRIRKMREEEPKAPEPEIFRSEGLQKEYDAEVKAGQEAVAKAKATAELHQAAWIKEAAEGEKKEG